MIFVTGCARSGTSLTTRILKAHGVNLGDPKQINPLYENTGIRQLVLKPYLLRCGGDAHGQRRFPDTENLPEFPGLREKVLGFISGAEPKGYKDAKLTFVWPAFADAFPEAKWILVRRDRERIIDSCLRTPFMIAHDTREGWSAWVDEHEKRFDGMRAHLDLVEVFPDACMAHPGGFRPVLEHCGLPFDLKATEDAIERKKWHER